ncbi:MAG: hypothetical protein AAFY71_04730 [Bacteroidota bacterium]
MIKQYAYKVPISSLIWGIVFSLIGGLILYVRLQASFPWTLIYFPFIIIFISLGFTKLYQFIRDRNFPLIALENKRLGLPFLKDKEQLFLPWTEIEYFVKYETSERTIKISTATDSYYLDSRWMARGQFDQFFEEASNLWNEKKETKPVPPEA